MPGRQSVEQLWHNTVSPKIEGLTAHYRYDQADLFWHEASSLNTPYPKLITYTVQIEGLSLSEVIRESHHSPTLSKLARRLITSPENNLLIKIVRMLHQFAEQTSKKQIPY